MTPIKDTPLGFADLPEGIVFTSGATFSDDRRYRYLLWRTWDNKRPKVAFCMLNPSTADALHNDPTVERCERRAHDWKYGGLIVVNLFALRSTDPNALYAANDPAGPENFDAIVLALKASTMFVCGWGNHGKHLNMGETVLRRIHEFYPGRAHALRLNSDGSPAHPLYLPYSAVPAKISTRLMGVDARRTSC